MYWWKLGQLREELVSGTLSERAQFQYLLIWVVIVPSLISFGQFADFEYNRWDWASYVIEFSVSVIGTVWLYRLNGGDRGTGFVERFLSLSWVFLLRFSVFAVPVFFVVVMVLGVVTEEVTEETGPVFLAVMTVFSLAYFLGLVSQFHKVVSAENAP